MKLSLRLKSIANLVDSNDVVADIGCDHAYLDIYLVLNNIVPKTLACDINRKALDMGINNIKKYGLEDKIATKLCDGITGISKDINTLIISGMGTSTIIKILSNDNVKNINKVITQSNNDYYELRKYMVNNGFYISYEESIFDKDKYYINMVFLRGNKNYSSRELRFGTMMFNKDYYEHLVNKYKYIYSHIPKMKLIKRLTLKLNIKYLDKYINN